MKFPRLLSRKSEDGQALVEFALVTPLLLLLVFGIVEFGLLWKSQQVLTDAAREGARVAVVADKEPSSVVRETIEAALERGGVSLASSTITVDPIDPKGAHTGTPVTIEIEHTYDFLVFDRLVQWAAGDITLSTSSVMRKE